MNATQRCLTIILLILLGVTGTSAQEGDTAPVSPTLQAQIDRVEANTEALRGLETLQPVPLRFPTDAEVHAYLVSELNAYYSEARVAELMAFYVAFDFLPPGYDLYGELLALYEQQVAGFYEPDTGMMNVILFAGGQPGDFLPLMERIIYAHEYVHALQDQHFDLAAYQDQIENDPNMDRVLALQALVEGDATAIMNEYTRRAAEANPLGATLQLALGGFQAGNMFLPPGTPDIFGAELFFAYLGGERFVSILYRDGGWDAVNSAYTVPPVSTEHILHPSSYLAGDQPIPVELPDGGALLGDSWSLAASGVMGEFYLREWLKTQLGNNETVDTAAAGWGGDAYAVYQDGQGALAWQLRLVWDSPKDVAEFTAALVAFVAARLPDSTPEVAGDVRCWSGEAALCLRTVGEGLGYHFRTVRNHGPQVDGLES